MYCNGNSYDIILKAGDDLFQDRIMEQMFEIINKLLNKDVNCKGMKLKTYEVIPIYKNCGFIEFVQNSRPFDSIFNEYCFKGIFRF